MAKLYEYLIYYRDNQSVMMLDDVRMMAERDMEEQKKAEILTREQENTLIRVIDALTRFALELKGELFADDEAFARVRELFGQEKGELDAAENHASEMLEHAFQFMEDAFGESQEMVAFVTELNANYYSVWFIRENGCDLYYRYNKGLLFDERHADVVRQMDEAESMLNAGIK